MAQEQSPLVSSREQDASLEAVRDDLGDKEILGMELEQLGNIDVVVPSFQVEVSSVTRSQSTVGKSPASVFVITNEMIRRSGATSLPEALRMAPGLLVARVDSNKWAISSRGFTGFFSNKLLVMIDGRTIYSPVFSGVHWESHDIVLEDIDRIEVIRGPGASAWGANAVNGVVNVITKHSRDTLGTYTSVGVGTEDRSINVFRSGHQSGDWTYRLFGKHSERDSGGFRSGSAADDWRQLRAGIRADWLPSTNSELMLSGEFVGSETGSHVSNIPISTPPFTTSFPRDNEFQNGYLQAKWLSKLSENESYWIQSYYNSERLDSIYTLQDLHVFDIEFQHTRRVYDRHQLTYGLGYRATWDDLTPSPLSPVRFIPQKNQTNLFSGYIQDEVTLQKDKLFLLAGCRFEHNSYSGFEIQPTLRLLRMLDERNAIWVAGSRAVRAPSRVDASISTPFLDSSSGHLVQLQGSPSIEAENLLAAEIGYRSQPNDSFSWDTSLFVHEYSDLVTFSPDGLLPGFPPVIAGPHVNQGDATFWGVESTVNWQVRPDWQLAGWYAFMTGSFRDLPQGGGSSAPAGFAQNQVRLTSSHDLTDSLQFDAMLRYVDEVEAFSTPAYTSLDLRLGWHLTKHCDISITGQNLLDSNHFEVVEPHTFESSTQAQRGAYLQLRVQR